MKTTNYLYIVLLFIYLININQGINSAECGNNAPPLPKLEDGDLSNYWDVDIYIDDHSGLLLDYGGVGNTTGALAQAYFSETFTLKFTVNDFYDLYFTYLDSNGVRCNRTTQASLITKMLPGVEVKQPKCLYSNATLIPLSNDVIKEKNFAIFPISASSQIALSMAWEFQNVVNFTFQPPFNGEYEVRYDSLPSPVPIKIQALNSLVPEFEVIPYQFNTVFQSLKIINKNSFSSISMINITNNDTDIISPQPSGNFPFINGFTYRFILESSECGTQIINYSPYVLPKLISNVGNYDCFTNRFNASFALEGANPNDYNMTINYAEYQGGQYTLVQPGSLSFYLKDPISTDYIITIPYVPSNISYTIVRQPTCQSDGEALIIYDGPLSDITLNNNPLTSFNFSISIDMVYTIDHKCFDSIEISTRLYPSLTIDSPDDFSCVYNFTVIVQNYNSFYSLNFSDNVRNIVYQLDNNGINTNIIPIDNFKISYQQCESSPIRTQGIEQNFYTIQNSDVEIVLDYIPSSRCKETVNVTANYFYKGKLWGQQEFLEATPGSLLTYDPPFCEITLKSILPNVFNTTTYKVISKPNCTESFATLGLVSEDLVDFDSLEIDGLEVSVNEGEFQVLPGKHQAVVIYKGLGPYYCESYFEIDVPTPNNKINYTVVNQNSSTCDISTGKITFNDYNRFTSLNCIVNSVTGADGVFNVVGAGDYIFTFQHDFCGSGQLTVNVDTDGVASVTPLTSKRCESEGVIFHPSVTASNGTIIGEGFTIVGGRNHASFQGITYIIGSGIIPLQLFYGQFCMWRKEINLQLDPKFLNEFTFKFDRPYDAITVNTALLSYNNSVPVVLLRVSSNISSKMMTPDHLYGISLRGVSEFAATSLYSISCQTSTVAQVEPSPSLFDIVSVVGDRCGSFDTNLKYPPGFMEKYMIRSNYGSLPNENGLQYSIGNSDQQYMVFSRESGAMNSFSSIIIDGLLQIPPSNHGVTVINESCSNSGDGVIIIENYDSNYKYLLYLGDYLLSSPINNRWSNLTRGDYTLNVVSRNHAECAYSQNIRVGSSQPQVTVSTINQCVSNEKGAVSITTSINGNGNANTELFINYTKVNGSSADLVPGNYNYYGIVSESKCKQTIQGSFEIISNLLTTQVLTEQCSTAKITVGNYLPQSRISIKLFNIVNGVNNQVGNTVTDYTATFNSLKNGTYIFNVNDDSSCQVTSQSFQVIECQNPTETPTETPVNQSFTLSPSYFIYLILLFISFVLYL